MDGSGAKVGVSQMVRFLSGVGDSCSTSGVGVVISISAVGVLGVDCAVGGLQAGSISTDTAKSKVVRIRMLTGLYCPLSG